MSSEEDQYFQCQELGHITCHWPNAHCFEYNEYGHIVADCPDSIPPLGTPAHCHRWNSSTRHHTRSTSTCHYKDRYRQSRSRLQSQSPRYRGHIHLNSHRGHFRSHNKHSGHHHRSTSCCHYSTHCLCHNTPHWRSSSCRNSLTHSRDCSRSRPHTA